MRAGLSQFHHLSTVMKTLYVLCFLSLPGMLSVVVLLLWYWSVSLEFHRNRNSRTLWIPFVSKLSRSASSYNVLYYSLLYSLHYFSPDGADIKNIGPRILGVTAGRRCQKHILKIPPPTHCAKCAVPRQIPPKSVFCKYHAIYEAKIENCRDRKCSSFSYKTGHSRVSLSLPISLKLYSKGYKSKFSPFFTISRSMRPRGKIVGVENVPREISYKVGHSRVSLDLPFDLEIHLI